MQYEIKKAETVPTYRQPIHSGAVAPLLHVAGLYKSSES